MQSTHQMSVVSSMTALASTPVDMRAPAREHMPSLRSAGDLMAVPTWSLAPPSATKRTVDGV